MNYLHLDQLFSGSVYNSSENARFIAVTLMSALWNKMRKLKLDEKFTVRQLLADLETLSEIRFSGRYRKLLTETTKAQRAIMENLGVPAETWLQK